MEEIVSKGLLLDAYGGLLTDKQRELYDAAVNEDMSLSEIAERFGISRQGVSDQLKRTTGKLLAFEEAVGTVKRQRLIREIVAEMEKTGTDGTARKTPGMSAREVRHFTGLLKKALDDN